MDVEKKLLGLLKDAAVMVHKYYYETNYRYTAFHHP